VSKRRSRRERKKLNEAKQLALEKERINTEQSKSRLQALLFQWDRLTRDPNLESDKLTKRKTNLLKRIHLLQRILKLPLLGVIKVGDRVTINRGGGEGNETVVLGLDNQIEAGNGDLRIDPAAPLGKALVGHIYILEEKVHVVVPTSTRIPEPDYKKADYIVTVLQVQ
jgi:hypothetical protein